jgi:drug/metabolite transporter (DMT)-like permease
VVRNRFSSAEVLLLVATAAWGMNYTAFKYVLTDGIEPLVAIGLRWPIAGLTFALLMFAREGWVRFERRDLIRIGVLGLVGICLVQIGYSYALTLAPASTIAIVFGLLPVAMAVVAQLWGIEHLTLKHWLGVAVSVVGVALIALGRGDIGGDVLGVLLGLATVLGFGAYSVGLFPLRDRYSPNALNALSICIAAVPLLALSALQMPDQDWGEPSTLGWLALLYSALGSVVLGNGLWLFAQQRVGPGRTGLYANLQPVFGVVFAVLLLSESLDLLEIVGGCVIAGGIVLARPRKPSVDAVPE